MNPTYQSELPLFGVAVDITPTQVIGAAPEPAPDLETAAPLAHAPAAPAALPRLKLLPGLGQAFTQEWRALCAAAAILGAAALVLDGLHAAGIGTAAPTPVPQQVAPQPAAEDAAAIAVPPVRRTSPHPPAARKPDAANDSAAAAVQQPNPMR